MAFDPALYDGTSIDPLLFAPDGDSLPDPDEQEVLRLVRNEIAAKSGYPSWEAYVRATGELRSQKQQENALQIKKLQDEIARGGQVSPASAAQLAQSSQQFAARIEQDRAELAQRQAQDQARMAEEQRQFNETLGANKARFNIEQQNALAESERQRQFQREQTLLQLGSRPDTLIRYLYALRGQQPPQGLTTTALPGFQRATQPATASVSPLVEGLDVPSPTASVFPSTPAGAPVGQAITVGPAGQQTTVVPNPTYNVPANLVPMLTPQQVQQTRGITLTGPGANAPTVAPSAQPTGIPQIPLPASGTGIADAARAGFHSFTGVPTSAAQNPNPGQPFYPFGLTRSPEEEAAFVAKRDREADIMEARGRGREYARGGVIPEPVVGMGIMSGQMYTFGENAMRGDREVVVPEHKVPKDMFERLMDGAEEVHYSEDKSGKRSVRVKRQTMNSYANGGPLGYRDIDPSVFNPPSVSNTFGFPQIPNLTGGTSLIPSSQRLFNALPSERALFSGYLRDEAGVQPDDVFEIARRLAPQGGMRAGRYVN
jgi:hypothetical protein